MADNLATDESGPYRVIQRTGHFEVTDATDRSIMICQDQHSAEHYVVGLNEAFRQGYKAGYRQGRKA